MDEKGFQDEVREIGKEKKVSKKTTKKQTNKQTNKQTIKQTNKQTNKSEKVKFLSFLSPDLPRDPIFESQCAQPGWNRG